jgi:hypothetical protein
VPAPAAVSSPSSVTRGLVVAAPAPAADTAPEVVSRPTRAAAPTPAAAAVPNVVSNPVMVAVPCPAATGTPVTPDTPVSRRCAFHSIAPTSTVPPAVPVEATRHSTLTPVMLASRVADHVPETTWPLLLVTATPVATSATLAPDSHSSTATVGSTTGAVACLRRTRTRNSWLPYRSAPGSVNDTRTEVDTTTKPVTVAAPTPAAVSGAIVGEWVAKPVTVAAPTPAAAGASKSVTNPVTVAAPTPSAAAVPDQVVPPLLKVSVLDSSTHGHRSVVRPAVRAKSPVADGSP